MSNNDLFNDEYEQVLCTIKEVHVFRIPPMQTAGGYKAEGWTQNHLWQGRCKVVAIGEKCEVRLEDPNTGKNFATCHVEKGAIESVTDSSRYFVLRIEDKRAGRHAFIGIGFSERSDAFEFNVALSDHEKHVAHMKAPAPDFDNEPKTDYSLNDGEKIKVNFKVKTKGKTNTAAVTGVRDSSTSDNSASSVSTFLPPPPSSGRSRQNRPTSSSSSTSSNNSSGNTLNFDF